MTRSRTQAASVFKTPYEVVGEGFQIAKAFYAECDRVREVQWAIAKSFGAKGYRPSHNGGMRSLFFKELPEGFREIGRDGDNIEAVPRKTTKVGKAAQAKLDAAPRSPQNDELARRLGWDVGMVISGSTIYHATASRIGLPTLRYLIMVPRHEDDEWTPPASLKELTQSEYRLAFHEHNAEVERRKRAA
ncbi:hypothetical protein [Aurantimonas sp. NFXS3]|uniref:hypothetical protein n=1 Tax=Aurantimonas sp. NFXS3 TaxID=2818434 RepID=UPI003B8EAA07